MKNYQQFLGFCMLLATFACAENKVDSILALTGNLHTKLIWVRWPWCDENYNPNPAYNVSDDNGNWHRYTQLMAFDTEEGKIRYVDSVIGMHDHPWLTKRDGSHVIYNDDDNECSWIVPFSGATRPRKLLDGGDYQVSTVQYDSVADQEFLYVQTVGVPWESSASRMVYRIPLKSDYTADLTQKVEIFRTSADIWVSSCSRDGLFLGVANPWPNCQILNVTSGELLLRKAEGSYGCHPNVAQDNSYRFYHLRDDHRVIRMWEKDLGTDNWDVTVNQNMPGNVDNHDCAIPRWSNNPRFFTISYPLTTGFVRPGEESDVFSMNANDIQTADPAKAGTFCLGRFSADFRSVESYVLISGYDTRRRDVNGCAWIAESSAEAAPPVAPGKRINSVDALFSGTDGSISILNLAGRPVARARDSKQTMYELDKHPAGIYIVKGHGANSAPVYRTFMKR